MVSIQLGFPAGGGADILARWYADKLQKALGGSFIVENKVGASGNLALDAAAKAKPDGYTLLLASTVTTAGNASVFKQMPLDVTKDIVPIVGFAETPFVLAVAPDSPINSIAELDGLSEVEGRQGDLRQRHHQRARLDRDLSAEGRRRRRPTSATRRPQTPFSDVTAKQIDFAFADVVFAMGQAKQNRIKILANRLGHPFAGLPDVPTLKELTGAATGDIVALWGMWAPAGTPKDILDKLGKDHERHHQVATRPRNS